MPTIRATSDENALSERHPYGETRYAAAIAAAEGWEATDVPEWGTSMLLRPIAAGGTDAIGPYPRAPIRQDADLRGCLERLRSLGLVSVVLVPDPLFAPSGEALAAAFPICRAFKTHYLLSRAAGAYAPSKHHRYEIRRARTGAAPSSASGSATISATGHGSMPGSRPATRSADPPPFRTLTSPCWPRTRPSRPSPPQSTGKSWRWRSGSNARGRRGQSPGRFRRRGLRRRRQLCAV